MKQKDHVVKYPGSIKNHLSPVEHFKGRKVYGVISKAGLPPEALFMACDARKADGLHSHAFTILLPSGEMFTGMAFHKPGDEMDVEAAACIAAGRAVAVWRAQKKALAPVNLFKPWISNSFSLEFTNVS